MDEHSMKLKILILLFLWLFLPTATLDVVAQNPGDTDERQRIVDPLAVEVIDKELVWPRFDSHLSSTLVVSNGKFRWRESFSNGEPPYFNTQEHELRPGVYRFKVVYVSNEMQEKKAVQDELVSKRKRLLGELDESVEAGDTEAVKRLYWQANEVRHQLNQANLERFRDGVQHEKSLRFNNGKFFVDEFGSVKIFDRIAVQKQLEMQKNKHLEKNLRLPENVSGSEGQEH